MKRHFLTMLLFIAVLALLAACAATPSFLARHPVEVDKPPLCSECHVKGYSSQDHLPDFSARHGVLARQQAFTCTICHAESFCADCHAHKEEIKPSDKYLDNPGRTAPHPGDYLTQHKIDGRIRPATCFPCHGRQNNARCRTCHS